MTDSVRVAKRRVDFDRRVLLPRRVIFVPIDGVLSYGTVLKGYIDVCGNIKARVRVYVISVGVELILVSRRTASGYGTYYVFLLIISFRYEFAVFVEEFDFRHICRKVPYKHTYLHRVVALTDIRIEEEARGDFGYVLNDVFARSVIKTNDVIVRRRTPYDRVEVRRITDDVALFVGLTEVRVDFVRQNPSGAIKRIYVEYAPVVADIGLTLGVVGLNLDVLNVCGYFFVRFARDIAVFAFAYYLIGSIDGDDDFFVAEPVFIVPLADKVYVSLESEERRRRVRVFILEGMYVSVLIGIYEFDVIRNGVCPAYERARIGRSDFVTREFGIEVIGKNREYRRNCVIALAVTRGVVLKVQRDISVFRVTEYVRKVGGNRVSRSFESVDGIGICLRFALNVNAVEHTRQYLYAESHDLTVEHGIHIGVLTRNTAVVFGSVTVVDLGFFVNRPIVRVIVECPAKRADFGLSILFVSVNLGELERYGVLREEPIHKSLSLFGCGKRIGISVFVIRLVDKIDVRIQSDSIRNGCENGAVGSFDIYVLVGNDGTVDNLNDDVFPVSRHHAVADNDFYYEHTALESDIVPAHIRPCETAPHRVVPIDVIVVFTAVIVIGVPIYIGIGAGIDADTAFFEDFAYYVVKISVCDVIIVFGSVVKHFVSYAYAFAGNFRTIVTRFEVINESLSAVCLNRPCVNDVARTEVVFGVKRVESCLTVNDKHVLVRTVKNVVFLVFDHIPAFYAHSEVV